MQSCFIKRSAARPGKTKLALDDRARLLDLGTDAGLHAFDVDSSKPTPLSAVQVDELIRYYGDKR